MSFMPAAKANASNRVSFIGSLSQSPSSSSVKREEDCFTDAYHPEPEKDEVSGQDKSVRRALYSHQKKRKKSTLLPPKVSQIVLHAGLHSSWCAHRCTMPTTSRRCWTMRIKSLRRTCWCWREARSSQGYTGSASYATCVPVGDVASTRSLILSGPLGLETWHIDPSPLQDRCASRSKKPMSGQ